jgi:hypothetical protein
LDDPQGAICGLILVQEPGLFEASLQRATITFMYHNNKFRVTLRCFYYNLHLVAADLRRLEMVFMSQSSSKPSAKIAVRGQEPALGPAPHSKPAADIRGRVPARRPADKNAGNVRGLATPEHAADPQRAMQGYMQWGGFMTGAPDGDFGFGAYFASDESSGADSTQSSPEIIEYTWTRARRG